MNKLVLIIDDNKFLFGTMIQDYIEAYGHKVVCSHGGASALSLSREFHFDVIIIDYDIADAAEITKIIRSCFPKSLIIGCSSAPHENTFKDAESVTLLAKPFALASLITLIEKQAGN